MIFFRPDTCYSSAHDTDASLTIDKYYDQVKMVTNMMTPSDNDYTKWW